MVRYVMHLVHTNADGRWHLEHEGEDVGAFDTKAEAEEAGKARGNALWDSGKTAQLVVHREDGSIETEYTYGKDPERHPG
ncbi:MAG: DUF2188 domain-containing protein [Dokdonella sp.]|uniref:DUF2188 domain-containing protein n=1 Tax=Dokdonella sp. TaxID=2291710 RepID=UPI003F7D6CBA